MNKIIINSDEKSTPSTEKTKSKDHAHKSANTYLWNKALEKKPNNPNFASSEMPFINEENILSVNSLKKNSVLPTEEEKSTQNINSQEKMSPFDLISKKEIDKEIEVEFSNLFEGDQYFEEVVSTSKPKKEININSVPSDHPNNDFQITSLPNNNVETQIDGFNFVENNVNLSPMISRASVDQIKEIILNLAEEIAISKLDGKTETTITIKNSDLFREAKIILTEFNSAPKEMNITFENLSQKAHQLILNIENQQLLKNSLDKKGLQIHIISATTSLTTVESLPSNNSNTKYESQRENQSFDSSSRGKKDSKDNLFSSR